MSRSTEEAIPLGMFSVLITAENLLVCTVLFRNKSLLRQSFINKFVVSLALADVLYGAVLLPMTIASPHNSLAPWLTTFILLVSVSNVFAIALDRYLAVTKPTAYTGLMNRYFLKIILPVWLVPIFVSALPLAWQANTEHIAHTVYILSVLLVGILIPYVLIMAAYICIYRVVKHYIRNMARVKPGSERDPQDVRNAKAVTAEARVAWLFAGVTAVFLFSWMPVIYMSAASAVRSGNHIPEVLMIVSWYTLSLGFVVHPLIYAFMKADIYKALKQMCCPLHSNRQADSQEMPTTIHVI